MGAPKRANNRAMARIKTMFESGLKLSTYDIVERAFMNERNAREYLRILHNEGAIHITAWRKSPKGPPIPVFSKGKFKDVARPKPMTHSEREKKRAKNPEYKMAQNARCRARRARNRTTPRVDPILSAFGATPQGARA